MTRRALLFFFTLFTVVAAAASCDEKLPEPLAQPSAVDREAGVDDFPDVSLCRPSGVNKGPWAIGMTRTSIHVRWEACTETSKGGVVVDGIGEKPSTATKIELTQRYVAAFNRNAPPDLPGTYFMHDAFIDGLTPGTCYEYSLAADPELGKQRFCTAQPDGGTVKLLAIADTNPLLGNATARLLGALLPSAPDFTIHAGDIQYYDSGLETWAGWFPVMKPLLAQGALHVAIGNHESEKEDELSKYALRFFGMPDQKTYSESESGGIHFFALNTEDSIAPETEQGSWLVARLGEVSKRPGYRGSIVFMHKPLVTCGDKTQDDTARNRYAPIFVQNKVPLVIQAHMHGYERFQLDDGSRT